MSVPASSSAERGRWGLEVAACSSVCAWVLGSVPAHACSVCFSPAADNPEAAGLGWAIGLLLSAVVLVQGAVVWFVRRLLRRADAVAVPARGVQSVACEGRER